MSNYLLHNSYVRNVGPGYWLSLKQVQKYLNSATATIHGTACIRVSG